MTRFPWTTGALSLLVVPATVVAAARPELLVNAPPSAALPIGGTLGVSLAHVLAAMPLAWLICQALPRGRRGFTNALAGLCLASIALLGLYAVSSAAYDFAETLSNNRVGWEIRFGVRALGSLVVTALWMIAVRLVIPDDDVLRVMSLPCWGASLVALVAIPLAQLHAHGRAQLRDLDDHFTAGRTARAHQVLNGLTTLGVPLSFRGHDLATVQAELDRTMSDVAGALEQPLDVHDSASRIERAAILAQLGRLDEALETLDAVRFSQPEASHLAGAILQERGAYSASDAAYRRALALLATQAITRAGQAALAERAYAALAFNARAERRFDRVSELYQDALRAWPERSAVWHYELGRHYHSRGHPRLARHHFEQAAALDPKHYANWRLELASTLDFQGLLTLCTPSGTFSRPESNPERGL